MRELHEYVFRCSSYDYGTYNSSLLLLRDIDVDVLKIDRAFVCDTRESKIHPDVKVIAVAYLYGTPGKIDEIKKTASAHGAVIVEDEAESLGATYN